MIKTIGYTDDGRVFFTCNVNIEGKDGDLTVGMSPDNARKVIEGLEKAIEQAPKYNTVVKDERERANLN